MRESVLVQDSWQRVELKYALSAKTADDARRFVLPFVSPDEAAGSGSGVQRVTSLYLDTPRADFYRCHTASQADRLKLRVRYYGAHPGAHVYFEIKRKVGHVIDKRRACIPANAAMPLLCRRSLSASEIPAPARERLQLFVWLMNLHDARPKVLVRCEREAYCSSLPLCDGRVTFDRDTAFQPVAGAILTGHPDRWQRAALERGSVVLELKYSGSPPSWMRELALRLGPSRVAYSKYVAAVGGEMSGTRPWLDGSGGLA